MLSFLPPDIKNLIVTYAHPSVRVLSFDVGVRNLSFVLIDYVYSLQSKWSDVTLRHWEVVDVLKEGGSKANVKSIPIANMRKMVLDVLQKRIHLLEGVTHILVEQQPLARFGGQASGSSRMKNVEGMLMTFYETYFRFFSSPHGQQAPIILSSSAKNKLRCVLQKDVFQTVPTAAKDLPKVTYAQRKQYSVDLCKQVLEWAVVPEEFQNMLKTHKSKPDDLADCVMQAIFFLQTYAPPKEKKTRKSTEKAKSNKRKNLQQTTVQVKTKKTKSTTKSKTTRKKKSL